MIRLRLCIYTMSISRSRRNRHDAYTTQNYKLRAPERINFGEALCIPAPFYSGPNIHKRPPNRSALHCAKAHRARADSGVWGPAPHLERIDDMGSCWGFMVVSFAEFRGCIGA